MEVDQPDVHVEIDVGNLCISNIVPLKYSFGREINEDKIRTLAAIGVQKLFVEILKLPTECHEHVSVVKLPEPTTVIPREKHVPKPKPPTKWETFAKAKGIQNRKKDKLVWDENSKEWKTQFGYRSAKNNSNDWLIEIPDKADPNVDYFGKKNEEKKERIAKNEYQRLRNIAVSQNMKVTNLEAVDRANKDQLSRSLVAAKTATASIGRFTDKLPKERQPKDSMKKRKFKSNFGSINVEKENNLKIIQDIYKKAPQVKIAEAVQKYIVKPLKQSVTEEQKTASLMKKNAKKNRYKKNLYRSHPRFKI